MLYFVAGDSAKVIVVFGATGQQGSSVVDALKDDNKFVVKAVTRDRESDKAKQLAAEGEYRRQLYTFSE